MFLQIALETEFGNIREAGVSRDRTMVFHFDVPTAYKSGLHSTGGNSRRLIAILHILNESR